jgi:peptidoglycan L-alanyl-D-glutamate endopeptidase CwlK
MPVLSNKSKAERDSCDPRLIKLIDAAIKDVDFVVVEGHRNKERQDAAFAKGASKVRWPYGNHNKKPSKAFDFAPYPIDWSDKVKNLARFMFVAGVLHAHAKRLGIKIRFGWDWNRDLDPRNENFMDWGHVELDETI